MAIPVAEHSHSYKNQYASETTQACEIYTNYTIYIAQRHGFS